VNGSIDHRVDARACVDRAFECCLVAALDADHQGDVVDLGDRRSIIQVVRIRPAVGSFGLWGDPGSLRSRIVRISHSLRRIYHEPPPLAAAAALAATISAAGPAYAQSDPSSFAQAHVPMCAGTRPHSR